MTSDFNTFLGDLKTQTRRLRRAERDESMTPPQVRELEKNALALIDGYAGNWLHYADGTYDACTSLESTFLRDHNKAMVGLLATVALQRPGGKSMTRNEFARRLRELKETFIRLERIKPARVQRYMGTYANNLAHINEELDLLPAVPAQGSAKNSGCYVATAVYGTYDCAPVWTLRRYRDEHLASSPAGRAFIRVYYTVSPTFVAIFGRIRSIQAPTRVLLNIWVGRLQARGYEGTPYVDRAE